MLDLPKILVYNLVDKFLEVFYETKRNYALDCLITVVLSFNGRNILYGRQYK